MNELPNAITFDGPALRVGVKLKLVVLPAEGAAPLGYCYPNKGDKVLKLFDGRGTLSCSVWWRGRSTPVKECGRPRFFPSHA